MIKLKKLKKVPKTRTPKVIKDFKSLNSYWLIQRKYINCLFLLFHQQDLLFYLKLSYLSFFIVIRKIDISSRYFYSY